MLKSKRFRGMDTVRQSLTLYKRVLLLTSEQCLRTGLRICPHQWVSAPRICTGRGLCWEVSYNACTFCVYIGNT